MVRAFTLKSFDESISFNGRNAWNMYDSVIEWTRGFGTKIFGGDRKSCAQGDTQFVAPIASPWHKATANWAEIKIRDGNGRCVCVVLPASETGPLPWRVCVWLKFIFHSWQFRRHKLHPFCCLTESSIKCSHICFNLNDSINSQLIKHNQKCSQIVHAKEYIVNRFASLIRHVQTPNRTAINHKNEN